MINECVHFSCIFIARFIEVDFRNGLQLNAITLIQRRIVKNKIKLVCTILVAMMLACEI